MSAGVEYLAGRRLVIATMHGKEQVIAPLLEAATGVQCMAGREVDTDRLGTFTGEVPRIGTAWTETVGQSVYEYNVVGTNVPVTVAAGTFSCYKVTYHQRNTVNTDTIYYSPSAGEVKYDGFALSYELESKNF